MKMNFRPLAVIALLATGGCGVLPEYKDIEALRTQLSSLEEQVSAQAIVIGTQAEQLAELDGRRQGSAATYASLDPAGSGGYAKVDTSVAPLLVSFVGTLPNADGTKLELVVGNLTSARFSGGSITVAYAKRAPENADDVAQWNNSIKRTTHTFITPLLAGTWNKMAIPLPGIKPDELGHLVISMEVDTVYLAQ